MHARFAFPPGNITTCYGIIDTREILSVFSYWFYGRKQWVTYSVI